MAKEKDKNIDRKSSFPAMEEEILNFWEKNKIFEKSVENPPHPPFRKGVLKIMFFMMARLLRPARLITAILWLV